MSSALALGAAAVLALVGLSRRGSRQRQASEQVDIDAFETGYYRGLESAKWADWPDEEWEGAEPQAAYESLAQWSWEAQENSRSYSPFEHTAARFNRSAAPQLAWESFQEGVAAGIDAGARERLGMEAAPLPQVMRQPEPPPPPKLLPAVIPRQRRFTRGGFPWPKGVPLYHGTFAMQAIARQGFRTRAGGAPQMMGGRHRRSVSTTLEPRRAAAIALYLSTLGLGARGELGVLGLYKALRREAPEASEQALTGVLGFDAGGWNRRRQILRDLDGGWTLVRAPFREAERWRAALPSGAAVLDGERREAFLLPPGASDPRGTDAEYGLERIYPCLLRRTVQSGRGTRECFDPIIYGAGSLSVFRPVPSWSYGVVEMTTAIPRVCADLRGAVRLGYLPRELGHPSTPEERYEARRVEERMQTWYTDCSTALEGPDSEYERKRVERRLNAPGMWGMPLHRLGDWVVSQQGRRGPRTTMIYHDGEEEVRVYEPRALRIRRVWSMEELRRRWKLGARLTFPYYRPDEVDVRVWPPGVRRRGRGRG